MGTSYSQEELSWVEDSPREDSVPDDVPDKGAGPAEEADHGGVVPKSKAVTPCGPDDTPPCRKSLKGRAASESTCTSFGSSTESPGSPRCKPGPVALSETLPSPSEGRPDALSEIVVVPCPSSRPSVCSPTTSKILDTEPLLPCRETPP